MKLLIYISLIHFLAVVHDDINNHSLFLVNAGAPQEAKRMANYCIHMRYWGNKIYDEAAKKLRARIQ